MTSRLRILSSLLVSVSSRVVLRTNNQTSSLLSSSVDGLNNINQLLFILQHPIQLVVITSSEITHHVLVAEEEHDGHGIVKFVHLVEVRDLVEIADVDDGKVFDAVGDAVEDFVLAHAVFVPVAAEADDYEAVFFGHDGLVDVPAAVEMREDDGTHGCNRWESCMLWLVGRSNGSKGCCVGRGRDGLVRLVWMCECAIRSDVVLE